MTAVTRILASTLITFVQQCAHESLPPETLSHIRVRSPVQPCAVGFCSTVGCPHKRIHAESFDLPVLYSDCSPCLGGGGCCFIYATGRCHFVVPHFMSAVTATQLLPRAHARSQIVFGRATILLFLTKAGTHTPDKHRVLEGCVWMSGAICVQALSVAFRRTNQAMGVSEN